MNKSYRQSSVVKDFGQWVVTKYGLECSTTYYPIPKERLDPHSHKGYPVERHMAGKNWIDVTSFTRAVAFARAYHRKKAV